MGNPRAPSAWSAWLDEGRDGVAADMAVREVAFRAAGVPGETRPPLPHVTLARPLRTATPAHLEAGRVWASHLQLEHIRLRLDRVALYTWSDERRERLFARVADLTLADEAGS